MIEQRAVAIGSGFELTKKIRELLYMISVDADHLLDQFRIARVMRDGVMGFGNTDFAVCAQAAFAADHERCYACGAGLESQQQEIEHQFSIVAEVGGDASRLFKRGRSLQ